MDDNSLRSDQLIHPSTLEHTPCLAFQTHEKKAAKKDPEHAKSHKTKERIAAAVAVGSAGFAFHEHHKKKEAKKHRRHAPHH
uniref:Uncharacterized protein n=1 Tax=Leersia perrieri TaxID=77586 RepID=A0A0D9VAE1_9ORYZ